MKFSFKRTSAVTAGLLAAVLSLAVASPAWAASLESDSGIAADGHLDVPVATVESEASEVAVEQDATASSEDTVASEDDALASDVAEAEEELALDAQNWGSLSGQYAEPNGDWLKVGSTYQAVCKFTNNSTYAYDYSRIQIDVPSGGILTLSNVTIDGAEIDNKVSSTEYVLKKVAAKTTVTVTVELKVAKSGVAYPLNIKMHGQNYSAAHYWENYFDLMVTGVSTDAKQSDCNIMYRLYNPNSGEHFYTANKDEMINVRKAGWNFEGAGWIAPKKSKTAVYRLYNKNGGEHHYTMSAKERDSLIKAGWKYEGIGWYSDDAKGQPLYREYNPNQFACNHNYTTSKTEHDNLVKIGWKNEGTAWYGVKI